MSAEIRALVDRALGGVRDCLDAPSGANVQNGAASRHVAPTVTSLTREQRGRLNPRMETTSERRPADDTRTHPARASGRSASRSASRASSSGSSSAGSSPSSAPSSRSSSASSGSRDVTRDVRAAVPAIEPETRAVADEPPSQRAAAARGAAPGLHARAVPRGSRRSASAASIGAGRHAARRSASPCCRRSRARASRRTTSTSGRSTNFPEGEFVIATFLANPTQGEVSPAHGVHPQQRPDSTARRAELHDPLQPLRPPRLPGAAERPDRRGGDEEGQGRRAHAGARQPASAARATAACTTPRATAPPARPCARSTATSSRSRTATSCSASSSASATSRARARTRGSRRTAGRVPGRARRRHRGVALPDRPEPGDRLDGRQVRRRSSRSRRRSSYPLDWLEERSGLVGGIEVLPLPQGPARHQLVADARRRRR